MAVLDRRCGNLERPAPQSIKCNVQDCPPHWGGYWGTCAVSCGQGVQKFVLQCEQALSNGRTAVVNEVACPRPKPQETTKPCMLAPCDENTSDNELHQTPDGGARISGKEWSVGPWTQVSYWFCKMKPQGAVCAYGV